MSTPMSRSTHPSSPVVALECPERTCRTSSTKYDPPSRLGANKADQQAAVKASREGSTSVKLKHFEWAKGQYSTLSLLASIQRTDMLTIRPNPHGCREKIALCHGRVEKGHRLPRRRTCSRCHAHSWSYAVAQSVSSIWCSGTGIMTR
jgi:hypothetical protein